MLIEIHMIKNFNASNLNRDEDGSPKTCYYNGTLRGQISAYCQKRTWRNGLIFTEMFDRLNLERGIRTRQIPTILANSLRREGYPDDIANAVAAMMSTFGKAEKKCGSSDASGEDEDNASKKEPMAYTKQVVYYGPEDIHDLYTAVKVCIANKMHPELAGGKEETADEKKTDKKRPTKKERTEAKADDAEKLAKALETQVADLAAMPDKERKTLAKTIAKAKGSEVEKVTENVASRQIPLDIAMFARMTTSDAMYDVPSPITVARAMSTHEVRQESEMIVALDDMLCGKTLADKGAALLDVTEFNSSCYYNYVSLDTDVLKANLANTPDGEKLIPEAVRALLRAMAYDNPAGSQSSNAAQPRPSAMLVTCRDVKIRGMLSSAFENAVTGDDIVRDSVARLAEETDLDDETFGVPMTDKIWFSSPKYAEIAPKTATQTYRSFEAMVNAVVAALH